MKVIDLLNKIANGEIPKKIKFDNRVYTFDEKKDNYYENETCSINWDYVSLHCLNNEVEIIEEDKKIEKIPIGKYKPSHRIKKIEKKLNELIDEVNKLKDDNK